MVPLRRWTGVLGFEMFAMIMAILGLGASSRITWKAIEVAGRPIETSQAVVIDRPVALPSPPTPASIISVSRNEPRKNDWVFTNLSVLAPPPLRLKAVMPSLEVPAELSGPPLKLEPRRVRVGIEDGQTVVAREYGGNGSQVVLLPNGRLGWPNEMVFTDEPFQPISIDKYAAALQNGPYRHFGLVKTDHYLVFYTGTPAFAKQSGQLLESLYRGLQKKFTDMGLAVHEAEFPLVAVIFRNETEFREHQPVADDVQAYFEVVTNQIFFFQDRDRDPESPRFAAMRKPQTVAHEGTHQILMNIGVQPRLANWPPWLMEGLAEYAAPTSVKGAEWEGCAKVNPTHIATIQELDDSLSLQGKNSRLTQNQVGMALGSRTVQELLERTDLSPTDYAISWGLTHYLAAKRSDEFVSYLNEMSQLQPMATSTAGQETRRFRRFFGNDFAETGKALHKHLSSLKRPDPLPYFAVIFEQPLGDGLVRRGTMVSQSPLMIRQWIDTMAVGFDAPFVWQPYPFAGRSAAFAAAEKWIQAR